MKRETITLSVLAFLVLCGIIIGILILVESNNEQKVVGKAILETPVENQEVVEEKVDKELICSGTQCNPENSLQICQNGKWVYCTDDKVCNSGLCVTPKPVKVIASGGGGGGGGGGTPSSDASSTVQTTEETSSLGEISGGVPREINLGVKALFTINGTEHSIKLIDVSSTSTTVKIKNGDSFSNTLGQLKLVDDDNNGQNDFSIELRSVNIIEKRARFIITQL